MKNTEMKHMSRLKKNLIIILMFPALLLIFIIGNMLVSNLLDNISKGQFEALDTQSRALYKAVVDKSNKTEDWTYTASCEPERSGWMTTGLYFCTTLISTEITTTTAAQLSTLHEKYYPVIDSSSNLKPSTELDKQLLGQFGVDFVVSSAEKHYTITNNNAVSCTYLAKLAQPKEDNTTLYDHSYGAPIATSTGRILLSLTCTGEARGDWYGQTTG